MSLPDHNDKSRDPNFGELLLMAQADKSPDGLVRDIVERPTIVKPDGTLSHFTPEMELLNPSQLRFMANQLGGTLAYRKYRVIYEELEHPFCDFRGCYALARVGQFCEDHKK